jgi:chromosomal replication initiation ATPase DnaA
MVNQIIPMEHAKVIMRRCEAEIRSSTGLLVALKLIELDLQDLSPATIIEIVAKKTAIHIEQILGQDRHWRYLDPRYIAIHLIKRYLRGITLMEIGAAFNRNHTTIGNALNKADLLLETDDAFKAKYTKCRVAVEEVITLYNL